MNSVINLSPLQKYLRATAEARSLQMLLRGLIAKEFTTEETGLELFQQMLPYEVATFVHKLVSDYHIDIKDHVQMQVFLKNILIAINDLPVVSITIARPPGMTSVTSVQEWFLREYKKLVLLDISVDSSLIAGGVISFKGRYYDCSLKKKLESQKTQDV